MEPPTPRLTNADFKKLMATPRHPSSAPTPAHGSAAQTPGGGAMGAGKVPQTPRARDKGKADKRREKKTYYAKLKKDEDDKMAELAAKYRDRAKERRDGTEGSVPTEDTNNAYRAVAPNAHGGHDAAERRKQLIHESKYLGGDMEHTHLVKGLDFALLQKVRAEIEAIETAKIDEEEEEVTIKEVSKKAEEAKAEKKDEEKPEEDKAISECRTTIGKYIYRLMFNPEIPKSNELFMPGRMAYVMDLEEDGETDIPTTSIRSKKDVVNSEQKATLSTNDIVINKLTQILSYLRAGNRTKRKKKSSKIMLSRERKPMFLSMMILEITDQVRRMTGVMTERETNTETMITERGIEMIIETEETEMKERETDIEMKETSIVMKEIHVIDMIETEMIGDKKRKVILINLMNRRRSNKEVSAMRTRQ